MHVHACESAYKCSLHACECEGMQTYECMYEEGLAGGMILAGWERICIITWGGGEIGMAPLLAVKLALFHAHLVLCGTVRYCEVFCVHGIMARESFSVWQ